MANADLNCPNCGAPVDFAGSTRATCSFCRSQLRLTGDGVQAAGMVSDLSGNRPVAPGVDLDEINELLLLDKKIEAIKRLNASSLM